MNSSLIRALAAIALFQVLAGCAQLGIPTPAGFSTPDTPIYEQSLSD